MLRKKKIDPLVILAVVGGAVLLIGAVLLCVGEMISVGTLCAGDYQYYHWSFAPYDNINMSYSFLPVARAVAVLALAIMLFGSKRSVSLAIPFGVLAVCGALELSAVFNVVWVSIFERSVDFIDGVALVFALVSSFLILLSVVIFAIAVTVNKGGERALGFTKAFVIVAALLYLFGYGAYFLYDVIDVLPLLDRLWDPYDFFDFFSRLGILLLRPMLLSSGYLISGIGLTVAALWSSFKPSDPTDELELLEPSDIAE